MDLNGTSQTAGAVTISSGSLQNGTLTNTSFAANNASALTLRASLAGSGGLTKTGNGTLTLTNQNAFTGSVFVKGGTLVMDTGSAIKGENRFDVCVTGHHALCDEIGKRHSSFIVLYRVSPKGNWGDKPCGWEPPILDASAVTSTLS